MAGLWLTPHVKSASLAALVATTVSPVMVPSAVNLFRPCERHETKPSEAPLPAL